MDQEWLRNDPFEPGGHPLETVGIVTDEQLRPVDPAGGGGGRAQRSRRRKPARRTALLRQRCGDGVALGSGLLAGRGAATEAAGRRAPAVGPPVASGADPR